MPEERVVEPELQEDRYQSQRYSQQRKYAELAGAKVTPVDRHKKESESAVDHAADAEDQRVLYCLFDSAVDRDLTPQSSASVVMPRPLDRTEQPEGRSG